MGGARAARSLCVALAIVWPAAAGAAPCDESAFARHARTELREQAHRAELWNASWTTLFAAGAVGSLALGAVIDDPGLEASQYVTSAKATIAAGAALVLRLRIPELPPCATDAEARAALRRAAAAQRDGRSWVSHAESIGLNLVGLAILGAQGYWREGFVNAGLGLAVGELRIFTQPMGATNVLLTPTVAPDGQVGLGLTLRF